MTVSRERGAYCVRANRMHAHAFFLYRVHIQQYTADSVLSFVSASVLPCCPFGVEMPGLQIVVVSLVVSGVAQGRSLCRLGGTAFEPCLTG